MAVTGRLYSVSFAGVAITATQDLFTIIPGATKICAIHSFELAQVTKTSVEILRARLRLVPATVTAGSGGSAPTPVPFSSGDAAATFTARANDTTPATSSGTILDLWADQWNLLNGLLWVPPITNRPFVIAPGAAAVLSLGTAPAASITASGTIVVEELP